MLVAVSIIVLLIFGLLFIFAEVLFVPGTTFVGLAGVLFSGIGIYFTFSNYGATLGWTALTVNFLLLGIAIVSGLRGGVWKKFSLQSQNNSRFNSEEESVLKVGDTGKTISDLRPIGKAEFNGQFFEVKTYGSFVKSGTLVQIVKLELNNIFVKTLTD